MMMRMMMMMMMRMMMMRVKKIGPIFGIMVPVPMMFGGGENFFVNVPHIIATHLQDKK